MQPVHLARNRCQSPATFLPFDVRSSAGSNLNLTLLKPRRWPLKHICRWWLQNYLARAESPTWLALWRFSILNSRSFIPLS